MSETRTGILTGTRPKMAKVRVKSQFVDKKSYIISFTIEEGSHFTLEGLNEIGRIRLDINANTTLELTPDTSSFIEPEHSIFSFGHDVNVYFNYHHMTSAPSAISAYNALNDNIGNSINVRVTYNDFTPVDFLVEIQAPTL